MSRRVGHKVLGRAPWLRVAEIEYDDVRVKKGEDDKEVGEKTVRKWNLAERLHPSQPDDANLTSKRFDGVDVCAIIRTPSAPPEAQSMLVVISQYRAPVDRVCLEFPAGLIDGEEEPELAALRELKEETGYVGKVTSCSKAIPLAYEPGLTNSCFALVSMEVDGELPENKNPVPEQEEDEDIQVHLIPHGPSLLGELTSLCKTLEAASRAEKPVQCAIDGKLYTYALGVQLASTTLKQ